jgi:hypothetical protein
MVATGLVGGVDVMLGVMALTVVSGALAVSLPEQIAHVGGSLVFGIGLVLLVVGRSELFTENFLVPVAGVLRGRSGVSDVLRLWGTTMLANLVGLLIVAAILTRAGLVPPETLDAAGALADTFAERNLVSAFLSAVLAGTTMTLFIWLAHAVERDSARVLIAMLIGFHPCRAKPQPRGDGGGGDGLRALGRDAREGDVDRPRAELPRGDPRQPGRRARVRDAGARDAGPRGTDRRRGPLRRCPRDQPDLQSALGDTMDLALKP